MKKSFVLLLLIMCISFVSCHHTSLAETKAPVTQDITESTEEPTNQTEYTHPESTNITVKEGTITIYDYDIYLEYMDEHDDILEFFVPYEKIKGFGKFVSFILPAPTKKWNGHVYYLEDDIGKLSVGISTHKDFDGYIKLKNEDVDLNNMDSCGPSDQSVFTYQGITYFYDCGNLCLIYWEHEGIIYSVAALFNEYKFYQDGSTLAGKLLNAYEAPKIIASIMEPDNTDATE